MKNTTSKLADIQPFTFPSNPITYNTSVWDKV